MAAEDYGVGTDEDQVTYAGRPVVPGSEQDRITRAMRRYRDQQATQAAARNDMQRVLAGQSAVNPGALNDALQSGALHVTQVPVLPVASGSYMGTEDFTEAAGAPSSLPGGFGIQPQPWGTGNRRQRAFESVLERQADFRDRRAYEHDLRIGDAQSTQELRKAFEVFKNNLPASSKMRFAAYLKEQARNAKLGATKEKPASWLDLGRFQEWEREQREIEYRQTVADKGADSPEAKELEKRINIDPSKKWTAASKARRDEEEQKARLDLAKEEAAARKEEREQRARDRQAAAEAKKTEGGKKALDALRRIREDAYKGSWSRALQAVRSSFDTMSLSPEEIADRAAALANKLYKEEVQRIMRGVSPEELDLIKKHGLEGKLFEMDQARPADAGSSPAAPAPATPGPGDETDPAEGMGGAGGGRGGMGGGLPEAVGGSGAPASRPWHAQRRGQQFLDAKARANSEADAAQAAAEGAAYGAAEETHNRGVNAGIEEERAYAAAAAKRRPAPMRRGPGTELPAPLPPGTARGTRPAFTPRSGGPELTPFDARKVEGPFNGSMGEAGVDAARRLMERPAGAAIVTGDMSEYAGASPATLESIARLKAQGVGDKAGELLLGDSKRANSTYGSIDGGEERNIDQVKYAKADLDRATRLLMSMPPPARKAELAKMRANPDPYLAAGVPVADILAMYQGA